MLRFPSLHFMVHDMVHDLVHHSCAPRYHIINQTRTVTSLSLSLETSLICTHELELSFIKKQTAQVQQHATTTKVVGLTL